jgi:IclR family acetate operon transcriptional repressor
MSNPLQRYQRILNAIATAGQGLSLSQLAIATNLPKSSVHRLATALKDINYIEIDEITDNFVLGSAILHLMRSAMLQDMRLTSFEPALNRIVGRLDETAFLARLQLGSVDLVHAITPKRRDRSYIYPGVGARPLDKCSSSKAILAFTDRPTAKDILKPLAEDGQRNNLRTLLKELDDVGRQGYAVCDGEIDEGVFSIACPVIFSNQQAAYSIGVVGPSARLKAHGIPTLVEVLKEAAQQAVDDILSV